MDTIFREIVDILETEVKESRGIRSVYYGDPGLIPKSSLPAITVRPETSMLSALGVGTGGTDRVEHMISIGLIYDMRAEFNKKPEQVKIVKSIMETIFERDSSGNLSSDTIVGAMRKYITLNSEILFANDFNVEYGVNDTREFPTLEALITFKAVLQPARPT